MSTVSTVNISNMQECVQETTRAVQKYTTNGGSVLGNFGVSSKEELIAKLNEAKQTLPPVYKTAFADPVIELLTHGMGDQLAIAVIDYSENDMLIPEWQMGPINAESHRTIRFVLDLCLSILENSGTAHKPTMALQEVVADLYDRIIASQFKTGVNPPEGGILPALVKWGNPTVGPYTRVLPGNQESAIRAPLVSLPPVHQKEGLMSWVSLGHETVGHDLLGTDHGLLEELGEKVQRAVEEVFPQQLGNSSGVLGQYWKNCVHEATSDVIGVLNIGPSAAIGLIAFFRGMNWNQKLRTQGPFTGPHPVDLLRGHLAAEVTRNLGLSTKDEWHQAIKEELKKDKSSLIRLENPPGSGSFISIPLKDAVNSAEIAANVLAFDKMETLEDHSFAEIRAWNDEDQRITDDYEALLQGNDDINPGEAHSKGFRAPHVLAAATQEALKGSVPIPHIFERMTSCLAEMHKLNSTWHERSAAFFPQHMEIHPMFPLSRLKSVLKTRN